jgi:hypothetical protein
MLGNATRCARDPHWARPVSILITSLQNNQDLPVAAALRKGDINDIINQLVGPRSPRSSTPVGSAGPSTPTLAPRNFSPTGRISRASGASSDRGAALLGEAMNGPSSGRVSRGSDTGSDVPGQGRALQLSPAPDSEPNA